MKTTNETPFDKAENLDDELLAEYQFDYRKAKPNRFADRVQEQQRLKVVVLDEDVARVFTTPEAVNRALKSLIETMPPS